MRAAQRQERDAQILQLFLAGHSYRAIMRQVGLKSTRSVHDIVQRELAGAAARRLVLADQAFEVWQERAEGILAAHYANACDVTSETSWRSALIVQRILTQQGRLYPQLAGHEGGLPAPTRKLTAAGDGKLPAGADDDEEPDDELSRLRARRSTS